MAAASYAMRVSSPVFVSYSHTDRQYVDKLVAFLRSEGFDIWIDDGIEIGTQWVDVVREKVDTCSAVVPS
jgi:hypothetical protein